MTDNSFTEKFWQFVGQTSPYPPSIEVASAEGSYLVDASGKRYLDFISGIAVTNVGHCHPKVTEAVCRQAQLYAHTMVYGEHVQQVQVELAEKIVSVAPPGMDCVYFLTTGAEANDAALKLAVKKTGRKKLVAFDSAYHGDTAGAMSCFGSARFRDQFPGLLASVEFLPFNCTAAQLAAIGTDVAAVVVEPVQGEGGIVLPRENFLQELRERCTEVGCLLIFDEVQTGFGRIGHWFAAEKYGVTPDVITMAKGMGAGYPLAGVLAARQLLYDFAAVPAFSHITTFGGHPVSCAAGLAAMQVIEGQNLLQNCRQQGAYLLSELTRISEAHPDVLTGVRGTGLMIGIDLVTEELARATVDACRAAGLIIETNLLSEKTVRFSPALTITREECRFGVGIFNQCIDQLGR